MKVAIYTRVSTDMQALEKCSLSVQAEKLQAYCQARDWNVVKIYTDPGYSGSNMERPALKAMIDDILAGYIDMVLVYKLDRLSRSQRDTLYMIEDIFLKNGADFVSMTENFDTSTPLGRAMIGILSVFAQLEREQIKERMAMGNVARAAKGLWRGGSGIPIGYDYKDGKIVTNEYERLQVETIYKMFLDGANYSTIMRHLQSKGYTHKYGPWKTIVTVKCVLANPVYIGKVKYAGEYYDGQHEKIIDEDTFYKVQKRIDEVTRGLTDHWKSPFVATKLLTGMIWCGDCGARYCGHSIVTKRPDGTRRSNHYYQCYTRNSHKTMRRAAKCNNHNRREEETDKIIISEIKKLALDPKG